MDEKQRREALRAKLRNKITDKSVMRTTKKHREEILDKGMEKLGIDKKKLMEAIKEMNGKK